MTELRLEVLSASNVVAANNLSMKPGQEQFITPVSYSVAAAATNPAVSWQRVVLHGDQVVGFIHGNFDPDAEEEEFRACLWRISVRADVQGHGVGTFAVAALADEARSRGLDRVTVIWEPGAAGPEAFFHRVGFTDVGQTRYSEVIGALEL